MTAQFDAAVSFTRQQEGGYSANPADNGNWTGGRRGVGENVGCYAGVTYPDVVQYYGRSRASLVTPSLMRNLPEKIIAAVYGRYWNALSADALPAGVDVMVFDFGFNAGDGTSGLLLQQALGFSDEDQDGLIGPMTLSAVGYIAPPDLVTDLRDRQLQHYKSLDSYTEFGQGWCNRTAARYSLAAGMAQQQES